MSYDPRDHGARCDSCALRGAPVVPPEIRPGAKALLVGEAPGNDETREGAPFVGRSGQELFRALGAIGVRRRDVSISNVLLCQPPENKLAVVLNDVRKANKRRAAKGEPMLPEPLECCAPRLRAEVAADAVARSGPARVVTLGGVALNAFGVRSSIVAVRGGPREIPGEPPVRLLPTLHPAFVLRARRWSRAFTADLGRAFRWFGTGLAWADPEVLYRPDADALRAWLDRERRSVITIDVETLPGFPDARPRGHYDPLHDVLRYLGLGSADGRRAVGIPFLGVETNAPLYPIPEGRAVVKVLRDFLTADAWTKAGWNSGYYDRMVIEAWLKVTPKPHLDGIGLHKMTEPELPHRLGYAGSIYTDAPSWKEEHDAKEIRTDEEMRIYNARDVAITAMTIPQLADAVRQRDQTAAARFWPKVQGFCVGLHRNGMHVDQAVRRGWDKRLRDDARHHLRQIEHLLDRKINPNSPAQLRSLFFEEWNLLPFGEPTETGEPSTGDDTLRAFLSHEYDLDAKKKEIVRSIRRFRAYTKERGTYVVKLRPIGEPITDADLAFDAEESDEERDKRIEKLEGSFGLVLPDGRVHGDFSAHGTVGWRLSSSRPNMQNFPDDLRGMITPAPGRLFVGCDEAQLELRMVAALAGAKTYLAALNAGQDPHAILCEDFFGDEYRKATKEGKKSLRRFVKEFTYASFYLALDPTKHSVLTASDGWLCPVCSTSLKRGAPCPEHAKTAEKRLLYPDLTLRQVTAFSRKWLDRNPEIETWWSREIESWKKLHYVAEPIFGLKRDCLDGEDPNIIVNYKAQSGGSALVHLATDRFVERYPFGFWGPGTGLVQQGHDSLVAEVPKEHEREGDVFGYCREGCTCTANRVAAYLQECMTMRGEPWGLPVGFTGEAKIGERWSEV